MARGVALAVKVDPRLHEHLVGVDDAHLTSVREDEDVPGEALDCFESQAFDFDDIDFLVASVLNHLDALHVEEVRRADADTATIVSVPQSEPVVLVQCAQPEGARIEDVRRRAPHDAVRKKGTRPCVPLGHQRGH